MTNWRVLTAIALTVGSFGLIATITVYVVGQGYIPDDHGIVIDSGSSHSRVTLYRWDGDKDNDTGLVTELSYCESHPGLAEVNISQIDGYFKECLDEVTRKISSSSSSSTPTPVYMGATAGLRLLNMTNPRKVVDLVDEVQIVLKSRGASLSVQGVQIISGQDEGLFAWVTANHLSDRLRAKKGQRQSTLATLDLGGASAQIAYEVYGVNSSSGGPELVDVRLYGIDHTVKASSNLCFGVDQAHLRLSWLLIQESPTMTVQENPCMPKGSNETIASRTLSDSSVCLKGSGAESAIIGSEDNDYTFTGTSDPTQCSKFVAQLLDEAQCRTQFATCFERETTSAVDNSTLLALSTYYYTARILKLSDTKQINRGDFEQQTEQFCRLNLDEARLVQNVDPKFVATYCFQLKYIELTLTKVYNLATNWSNVRFTDKIGSQSLGWSLGFMINATNAIPSEAPIEPLIATLPFVLIVLICSVLIICGILFLVKCMSGRAEDDLDIYEPIDSDKVPL